MLFRLKNVGATFQHIMNKMFRDLLGKSMEIYIDDILVKSRKENKHIKHLEATFEILD